MIRGQKKIYHSIHNFTNRNNPYDIPYMTSKPNLYLNVSLASLYLYHIFSLNIVYSWFIDLHKMPIKATDMYMFWKLIAQIFSDQPVLIHNCAKPSWTLALCLLRLVICGKFINYRDFLIFIDCVQLSLFLTW